MTKKSMPVRRAALLLCAAACLPLAAQAQGKADWPTRPIRLIVGYASRGASLLSTLLLVVFIAAMGYAYSQGYDTQCGCFTTKTDDAISLATFVRDGSILALALLVAVDVFVRARRA